MVDYETGVPRRYGRIVLSACVALTLVGCGGLGLLPHSTEATTTKFQSFGQVETAFNSVVPGQTRVSDLMQIGFDAATTPNTEMLSYLGVIERFMPQNSISYDHLAPAVRACIDAQDHCSAYIFRPSHVEEQRTGNFVLDLLGFERNTVSSGWSAEIVLLMQDGRVAYKLMSSVPRIQNSKHEVQPLGPIQDFGNMAVGMGSHYL